MTGPGVRPLTPDGLVATVLERVLATPVPAGATALRVLLDGAPCLAPGALADALVEPLAVAGRRALRVVAEDFQRPASVRLEHGRHDADAWLDDRLDARALEREVLTPLGPDGAGTWLPSLWDPVRDRATRAPRRRAEPGSVLLLDGAGLLGLWLEADLVVHLAARPATLARRTPEVDRWLLPALARYEDEVDPQQRADLVVRVDDPRHPALVERPVG